MLVTGGAGYIGSHTCVELLEAGVRVVVVDNLDNSSAVALDRVARAGARRGRATRVRRGRHPRRAPTSTARSRHGGVEAVIHFAGLKAVGESVRDAAAVLRATTSPAPCSCSRRWSATTCATSCSRRRAPCTATRPPCRSPRTRRSARRARTAARSCTSRRCCATSPRPAAGASSLLRYFNPVGAHPSGRIGEDPVGIPNNLMPYIMQVAVGRRDHLTVFGGDYPTPDGTASATTSTSSTSPRATSPRSTARPTSTARCRQPRHRDRQLGARGRARRRRRRSAARSRTRSGRAAPATSSRCGPTRRARRAARLAGVAHARRHVRRPLALAVGEPRRLPGELTSPMPTVYAGLLRVDRHLLGSKTVGRDGHGDDAGCGRAHDRKGAAVERVVCRSGKRSSVAGLPLPRPCSTPGPSTSTVTGARRCGAVDRHRRRARSST